MARLMLVGLLCVACTRPNTGFDEGPTTTGGVTGSGGSSTVDPDAADTTDPDTAAVTTNATTEPDPDTTDTLDVDLPPVDPVCPLAPSPGLDLQLGNPMDFGGQCPTSMEFWTTVVSNGGDQVVLDGCSEGCGQCFDDAHPLAALPLEIGAHLPPGDACLFVEAHTLLSAEGMRCHWGGLTIYNPVLDVPYVIAITRSSAPTATGAAMLGDAVPAPTQGDICECATVEWADPCCAMGREPPSFWYYTIGDMQVDPGEDAPIALVLPGSVGHSFQLFQAQQIPTCMDQYLEVSWAVVATP